mgnify:CR=1 FL=1
MRVVQMMAGDRLLPALFGKEKNDVPRIAVIAIFLCCLPIPFIGRTAMGWNADVSTLSTSIVYAYISICCFTTARKSKSLRYEVCGILGIIISAFSFIMLLVPNIFTEDVLSAESYLMFVVWSFLGIIFYWIIFKKQRRLGYSAVMWITMLVAPTPGGAGFAEYAFREFLSSYIPTSPMALAFCWRLISYYPYLIVGAILLPRWAGSYIKK